MKFVDEFRDPALAGPIVRDIGEMLARAGRSAEKPLKIMEVCGGHTHAIFRFGLEEMVPPGVELAGPVQNGVLRQGVVHLTTKLTESETISIPVRFSLPGTMLVPEAETRTTSEEQPRTLSPARWLTVH